MHLKNIIAFCVLFLIGVSILYISCLYFDTPIQSKTLCPSENDKIKRINVILVDRTEDFTEIQKLDIQKRFSMIIDNSSKGELFIIHEITQRDLLVIEPEFEICNPGRPKQLFTVENVVSRKKFDEQFRDKTVQKFDTLLEIEEQDDSPIMEMIQAVVIGDFNKVPETVPRRLIIISDMMQHSSIVTHYGNKISGQAFFQSKMFKSVSTPLENIDIEIWYVQRFSGSSAQPKGHKQFWNHYFTSMHARSVVFNPISGAGWGVASK